MASLDNQKEQPMAYATAEIKRGHIVIRIPVEVLAEEYVIPADLLDEDFKPRVKVTDLNLFARDFVDAMNREAEDGSTPITDLLDDAYSHAVDNGAQGISLDGED
jgi:hypothetical protein